MQKNFGKIGERLFPASGEFGQYERRTVNAAESETEMNLSIQTSRLNIGGIFGLPTSPAVNRHNLNAPLGSPGAGVFSYPERTAEPKGTVVHDSNPRTESKADRPGQEALIQRKQPCSSANSTGTDTSALAHGRRPIPGHRANPERIQATALSGDLGLTLLHEKRSGIG
jgi:hypothetical protein